MLSSLLCEKRTIIRGICGSNNYSFRNSDAIIITNHFHKVRNLIEMERHILLFFFNDFDAEENGTLLKVVGLPQRSINKIGLF